MSKRKPEQSFCYAPSRECGCILSIQFFSGNSSRGWRRRKYAGIIHIPGCICHFALGFCKNIKKRTETLYQSFSPFMAEKEGFEPSRQLSHPTPLAGEPLRPLGYFSMPLHLAEREGFEPPVPFDITGFQDQRLKPLGHLSPDEIAINIIAEPSGFVNRFPRKTSSASSLQRHNIYWMEKRSIACP